MPCAMWARRSQSIGFKGCCLGFGPSRPDRAASLRHSGRRPSGTARIPDAESVEGCLAPHAQTRLTTHCPSLRCNSSISAHPTPAKSPRCYVAYARQPRPDPAGVVGFSRTKKDGGQLKSQESGALLSFPASNGHPGHLPVQRLISTSARISDLIWTSRPPRGLQHLY